MELGDSKCHLLLKSTKSLSLSTIRPLQIKNNNNKKNEIYIPAHRRHCPNKVTTYLLNEKRYQFCCQCHRRHRHPFVVAVIGVYAFAKWEFTTMNPMMPRMNPSCLLLAAFGFSSWTLLRRAFPGTSADPVTLLSGSLFVDFQDAVKE
jgi:hypothetical protein